MTEETTLQDELKRKIEAKHFVRAAALAESSAIPLSEVKELRNKALWQMAAVFRNAEGTRVLCEQYGLSKKEAEDLLKGWVEEQQSKGDKKALEPTYDQATGKYLSFEEWLNQFLKRWDSLATS